jgi:cytochrome d ubiquinol oxidase subunit I
MILAAYMVAGFLIASVYAVGMLRGRRDRYHRLGFLIPFTVAAIATPVQLFVGDTAARAIAKDQPVKFASMEYVQTTQTHAPEYVGGMYHDGKVVGGVAIPGLDSFLVGFSTDTKVTGWNSVPAKDRPPSPTLLHLAFNAMVGIGSALLALGAWLAFSWWRTRDLPRTVWFLRASAVAGVGAVIALECGWIVTEVGRQPWIVYKLLRTEDAVTGATGIWLSLAVVLVLYAALGVATVVALRTMGRRWREREVADDEVPYGPPAGVGP